MSSYTPIINIRIWHSPRWDMADCSWNWWVGDDKEAYAFGCEKTETDARNTAESVRAEWQQILIAKNTTT